MTLLDYDAFAVITEGNRYLYHDKKSNSIEELELIAKEIIEPFSDHDSEDYLLNAYPEADVTGEDVTELIYYWFRFKETKVTVSLLVTMLDQHDCERYFEVNDTEELEDTLERYYAEGFSLLDIICGSTKDIATFFLVRFEDGIYTQILDPEKGIDHWFVELSRTIAFGDCSEERVIYIMHEGREIHYTGWKPGMRYEFADKKGNVIWSASFPEWDH